MQRADVQERIKQAYPENAVLTLFRQGVYSEGTIFLSLGDKGFEGQFSASRFLNLKFHDFL